MNGTDFDSIRNKAIGHYLTSAHLMEEEFKDRLSPLVLWRIRHYMEREIQETLNDVELYVKD